MIEPTQIVEESDRLNRLVGDLLDVTRLDGPGTYKLTGKMAADGDHVRLDVSEPAQTAAQWASAQPDSQQKAC